MEELCRADARWDEETLEWVGLWPLWGYSPESFARAQRSFAAAGEVLAAAPAVAARTLGPAGAQRAAALAAAWAPEARLAGGWGAWLRRRGHAEVDRLGEHRWIARATSGPWAAALAVMGSPPPWLYGEGAAETLRRPLTEVLAVVGTRRCDARGASVAAEIATAAAEAGWVVSSGGALGVDTAAHEATLAAGGAGLVVLGVGLEHPYPTKNIPLFRRLAASGGAVITPFHLDSGASRYHFPRRNAVLAALSGATVVVQAGIPSGALSTAEHALRYGRRLLAVPGDTGCALAQGPNRLLLLGATPLVEPRRVCSFVSSPTPGAVARQLALPGLSSADPARTPSASPPPDGPGAALWEHLSGTPRHVSELVALSRRPVEEVSLLLLELELEGRASRVAGGCYVRSQGGDI